MARWMEDIGRQARRIGGGAAAPLLELWSSGLKQEHTYLHIDGRIRRTVT